MAREKKDNVIVTFRIPKQLAEDFDEEIAKWNEETGASFTRSQLLKVLMLRFLIGRNKERNIEDNAKDNKNKEE